MHPFAFLDLNLKDRWFNLNGRDYFCIDYEIRDNKSIVVSTDSRKFVWKYKSDYENVSIIHDKEVPKKYRSFHKSGTLTSKQQELLDKQKAYYKSKKERDRQEKETAKLEKEEKERKRSLLYGTCNVYRCKQDGRFVSGIIHSSGTYEFGSFFSKTVAYRVYLHAKEIIKENPTSTTIPRRLGDLRVSMLHPTDLRSEMLREKPLGVDYMEKIHKWRVNIRVDGKPRHISLEDTEELGIKARARYIVSNELILKSENSFVSK